MGYVNCESAKDLVRIWLFEKKLSLFKEVVIFSIIIIVFKIGVIGTEKYYSFPGFLVYNELYGLFELWIYKRFGQNMIIWEKVVII